MNWLRTRTRDTVKVGDVVTTVVPGLAEALRRPGVEVDDLWRCLEIAAAAGIEPPDFDGASLRRVRDELWRQLGPDGVALGAPSSWRSRSRSSSGTSC